MSEEADTNDQHPAGRGKTLSEMDHFDFAVLVKYAEGAMDKQARKIVGEHLLFCSRCSAEWEHIESEVIPEMGRPISVSERLSSLAARLVRRMGSSAGRMNTAVCLGIGFLGVRNPAEVGSYLGPGRVPIGASIATLSIDGADDVFRFLTVLDEDDQGQLTLFDTLYEGRNRVMYCVRVEPANIQLPLRLGDTQKHNYQVYLTAGEIPPACGHPLDSSINTPVRAEERNKVIETFLETLAHGDINYRAAERKIEPERGPTENS